MCEYKEQCIKCFHFQVCAQVMKNQLFIRSVMLKEENPKCEHFIPAADVVEVKHGEWKQDGIAAVCGVCQSYIVIEQYEKELNYCPNCGAKMDGKDGDENE